MTLSQEQLEWIVSEVVRRLRETTATTSPTDVTASAGSQLVLTERLVTLETVRNRLSGVSQLEVARRAIVTPAVVDWLNEKKVELIRA